MNALLSAARQTPGGGLVLELFPPPDPWSCCQRLADAPHLLFLDSARRGPLGRFSFLAADPYEWLCDVPLSNLEPLLRETFPPLADLPPFQGGIAGLFGYDLCHELERLPRAQYDEFQIPALGVGAYDVVVAWDHAQNRAWVISTGMPEAGEARLRRAYTRIEHMIMRLNRPNVPPREAVAPAVAPVCWHPLRGAVGSNFTPAGFRAAIQAGIDYVHAGDCFQVNLSQRLLTPLREHPLSVYGRLRTVNPAPFAGYLDLGEHAVASASPERFLRLQQGHVVTRPIKGTRPRGANAAEDEAIAWELLRSEKDRAENVMIVDLLRNDLGRVCRYGSVRVEALCRLESYPTVHHLVSEVAGELAPGRTALDLLRAAFPGGSITGAPKVRAMQIIAELEPTARGPYCGSLGYLSFDGTLDTNILIRTFTASGGWLQFPVGGGIVADSVPKTEYTETLTKAEGLLRALEK